MIGQEVARPGLCSGGKCDSDHIVEHENPGMGIVQLKVVPMVVQNRQHYRYPISALDCGAEEILPVLRRSSDSTTRVGIFKSGAEPVVQKRVQFRG